MRPSEILRGLADMLDSKEQASVPPAMGASDYESECGCDSGCGCESGSQQPDDVFVPPLQLKLELLKKATGVDSIYDQGEPVL